MDAFKKLFCLVVIIDTFLFALVSSKENTDSLSRRRRQSRSGYKQLATGNAEISINFINKSGRRIRMFHSSPYGHEITFQFFLRPNEPRRVLVRPDGSFWVAYDTKTSMPMLINGFNRLETYLIRPGSSIDARISSASLPPERVIRDQKNLRFIETRVILDRSMINHYGRQNVNNYTLLIMNMVTRTFLHRSLGAPLFISLTDVHLMENQPSYYRIIPDHPEISVSAACRYAKAVQALNGTVDFSLILTRKNIGPAGYAPMFTMCTNRSCAFVQDKGPDIAFVIAHEIAHVLGIDHDEDDSCPTDNLSGGNLMVKKIYTTSNNYAWSKCSKKMIWQNLRYFSCLSNKPNILPSFKNNMDYLPGELMTMTDQCKQYHGTSARTCTPKNPATTCKYLWCHPSPYFKCRPLWWHSPLEGSSCAPGKWCIRGQCVKIVKRIPVDGGWSAWSSYLPSCDITSRSLVFQTRNRSCTNPRPQMSGNKCFGQSKQRRVLLPTKNGICKPYSLKDLILNSKTVLEELQITGCEHITKDSSWRIYHDYEQEQQVKSLNLTCDFESSGCQWRSSPRGVKSWNIGRGRTPSRNTGPSFDNTYKNNTGQYLYFEASWVSGTVQLKKGDRVILQSPFIMSTRACLRFAYHMYGRDINALEVFIRNGRHSRRIWQKRGNQGNKWHTAEINLKVNIEYKITIEAVKGQTYYSDIAIDDISLTYGLCKKITQKNAENSCRTVCTNKGNRMVRRQLPDGYPCKRKTSKNNVCFNGMCQQVNCHGVINGTRC